MTQAAKRVTPRHPSTSCRTTSARGSLAVQEKSGFIPNVFVKLAYRPDEFRAFFAYHDALMEKDSGLTKAEREMIVVATSSVNQLRILRDRARRDPAHPRQEPADRGPDRGQLSARPTSRRASAPCSISP